MKLYGVALSNFYNIAKLALLEKEIPFEEIMQQPGKNPEYLEISPLGKIPALVTDSGPLCESIAIVAYLEALKPELSLTPVNPLEAGRAMAVHLFVSNYIDAAIRPLFGAAFFGGSATEEMIESAAAKVDELFIALGTMTQFKPFVVSDTLSHADLAMIITLPLAEKTLRAVGVDAKPTKHLAGYADYRAMVKERPHVQKVMSDMANGMESFLAARRA